MSISYRIANGGRLVYTRASGPVTEEELLSYQVKLLKDPKVRPGFFELFDGTAAHGVDLADGLIEKLVAVDEAHADKLVRGKCAIVIRSDFELAEEFERLHHGPNEVLLFFNLDVASVWLGWEDQSE
jgi:hypothetical protein